MRRRNELFLGVADKADMDLLLLLEDRAAFGAGFRLVLDSDILELDMQMAGAR